MTRADVVVVGGGVAGCASAYFLARAGLDVLLLERGELAGGASGAAAGMLAPACEIVHAGGALGRALARWGQRSAALLPQLCRELEQLSGVDPEYQASGTLQVALSSEEAARLAEVGRRHPELGLAWLDARAARAEEPTLATGVEGALFAPHDAHVRSPLLTRAFAGAARKLGARVREGVPVQGLLRSGCRIHGVRCRDGDVHAEHVVICSGAWAGELGRWLDTSFAPPIAPVRGQIVCLAPPPPGLRRIVWGGGVYRVPKRDGSVVVGATEEAVGFDCRVTAAGVAALLEDAPRAVPGLAQAGFLSAWAGLRPGSPDGLPAIGPVPGAAGLWLAAGHHRNGVLLAPITGQLVAQHLLGAALPSEASDFDPARWLA